MESKIMRRESLAIVERIKELNIEDEVLKALSGIDGAYQLKQTNFDGLTKAQKKLVLRADKAKEYAYNPYSKFYVGAALLTENNRTFSGCNVENASYGLTNCAERTTIFKAVSEGCTLFKSLAIVTRGEDFIVEDPTGPCGACRQVIKEFSSLSGKDIDLILSSTKMDKIYITSIDELLPSSFGPADLGMELSQYKRSK